MARDYKPRGAQALTIERMIDAMHGFRVDAMVERALRSTRVGNRVRREMKKTGTQFDVLLAEFKFHRAKADLAKAMIFRDHETELNQRAAQERKAPQTPRTEPGATISADRVDSGS